MPGSTLTLRPKEEILIFVHLWDKYSSKVKTTALYVNPFDRIETIKEKWVKKKLAS